MSDRDARVEAAAAAYWGPSWPDLDPKHGDAERERAYFARALAAAAAVQAGDGKRMVDLNAVIEALDDVASKVLPGSDPTACVRAAAGVIEREFGGPAPSEEGESHE